MQALERIGGYGHVALRYGLEEAVFLDSIMYWYKENRANNRNFRDGRWWTYNSVRAFAQLFPWWSAKQLRRISESCRTQGAILAGNYNEDQRDRTLWYTPGDELLELYGEAETPTPDTADSGGSIGPNGPASLPERASMLAQMGQCNKVHVSTSVQTHEETPLPPVPEPPEEAERTPKPVKPKKAKAKREPDWKPERFAKFWDYYPRGESKQAAIRAWDKLKPSDELIAEMARALQRQMESESWQDGVGIPYASTWLNDQRWTDAPKQPPGRSGDPLESEGYIPI